MKKKILPQSLGKLKKEDTELFNIVLHTGKQLRHYKYENILFLISLVSSEGFIRQVRLLDIHTRLFIILGRVESL